MSSITAGRWDWLHPNHLLTEIRSHHPLLGLPLIAIALIPLLWGWRLIRPVGAAVAALGSWFVVTGMTTLAAGPLIGMALGIGAAVVGGILGWFCYQLLVAVHVGGLAAGAVSGLLIHFFAAPQPLWVAIGVVAFVSGAVLGWFIARPVGIAQTVLYGSALAGFGAGMLASRWDDRVVLGATAVTAGVAALVGLIVQIRAIPVETRVRPTKPAKRPA